MNYIKNHFLGHHSLKQSLWVNTISSFILGLLPFAIFNALGIPLMFAFLVFGLVFMWGILGTIACCLRIIKNPNQGKVSNQSKFWAIIVISMLTVFVFLLIKDVFIAK